MDLRELYEAIVGNKHLRRTQRFIVGNKRFAITYEVHHKYLTITKIKRISKSKLSIPGIGMEKRKPSLRVLYRRANFRTTTNTDLELKRSISSPKIQIFKKSLPKLFISAHTIDGQTQTDNLELKKTSLFSFPSNKTFVISRPLTSFQRTEENCKKLKRKSTQTCIKYFKSQQTATDEILSYSKAEQTAARTHSLGCQTDAVKSKRVQAIGINAKPATQNSSNQTDTYYYSKSTQTTSSGHTMTTQTDLSDPDDYCVKFCEAIINLLNEIGESLLLQNSQFEQINRSVVQLCDWTFCINRLIRLRKRKCKCKSSKMLEPSKPPQAISIATASMVIGRLK